MDYVPKMAVNGHSDGNPLDFGVYIYPIVKQTSPYAGHI